MTTVVGILKIADLMEQEDYKTEIILGFETELDDDVCDKCKGYHGLPFTEAEAIAEFEYLIKVSEILWKPYVHPNCRCRLIVIYHRVILPKIETLPWFPERIPGTIPIILPLFPDEEEEEEPKIEWIYPEEEKSRDWIAWYQKRIAGLSKQRRTRKTRTTTLFGLKRRRMIHE